jgi:hypothetical protein
MENDVILYMAYALIYAVEAGLLLFVGKHTVQQLKGFGGEVVPQFLRRIFDPGSIVIKFLKSRGIEIDQAQADQLLETIANAIESALVAPPQEVNLDSIEASTSPRTFVEKSH